MLFRIEFIICKAFSTRTPCQLKWKSFIAELTDKISFAMVLYVTRVRTAIRAAVELSASSSKTIASHLSRECAPWLDLHMDREATRITKWKKNRNEASPILCLIPLRISLCPHSLMRTVLERNQQTSRSQRTNFGRESWLASPSGWESSSRCFQPISFARRIVWCQ